jgi:hypothetical protein
MNALEDQWDEDRRNAARVPGMHMQAPVLPAPTPPAKSTWATHSKWFFDAENDPSERIFDVRVAYKFQERVQPPAAPRTSRAFAKAPAPRMETRRPESSEKIELIGMSREAITTKLFSMHKLEDLYEFRHDGPPFSLWCTSL